MNQKVIHFAISLLSCSRKDAVLSVNVQNKIKEKRFDRSYSVYDILERNNCDPIDILCKIANNDTNELNLTAQQQNYFSARLIFEAAQELAVYLYPKIKPKEADAGSDSFQSVVILPDNGTGT